MIIGDLSVQGKGLKEGFKIFHETNSINQAKLFQVSIKDGSWRGHFSLERGKPPNGGIDKHSAWKADMEVMIRRTFEMLS